MRWAGKAEAGTLHYKLIELKNNCGEHWNAMPEEH
jgi:hypothetical protein